MRNIQIVLWCLVAVMSGVAGYLFLNGQNTNDNRTQTASVKIGGPFNLVRHDGSSLTEKNLAGRRHAIFFGFTQCPDICPTTLYETAGWMNKLGQDGEKIDFYFFSVDPERDTVEVLKDYVNAFDPRITGVTGQPEEVFRTIKSYKAYAKRVELDDGDYTMDHSAFVMLFDTTGDFKGTISYGENDETALAKLRRLIEKG